MLNIKFGKLPGAISEYVVESGTTVRGLLEIAGTESDGFAITVNGEPATLETVLQNNQNVILAKSAKGNN